MLAGMEALEGRQLLAGEPWGAFPRLLQQDMAAAAFPSITGAGQTIAIIDTGVDYLHPNLGGGIGTGYKVLAGYNFVNNNSDPMDHEGHGTGVASAAVGKRFVYRGNTYQGVAPGANMVALRVDDFDGIVDASMESALRWVIQNRVRYNIVAINISDGGWDIYPNKTTTGSRYSDEFQQLKDSGVFIVACSGNDGVTSPLGVEYPAADPSVFSVGSINSQEQVSSFSTRGPILDMVAGGENLPIAYTGANNSAIYLGGTGTSFSAPQVAGAAALLKQVDGTLSPDDIADILKASSLPVYDKATGLTFDRLDVYNAIALAMARKNGVSASTYLGFAFPVPGTIECEKFDNGGEGVGFHDRDAANRGGALRGPGVDVEVTSDTGNGYQVGFTRAGEWLSYTINVAAGGTYNFYARVSAPGNGGGFHIEVDGINKSGPMSVPDTHGWSSFQTIASNDLSLSSGTHTLRLVMDDDGASGFVGNFNWLKIKPSDAAPGSSLSFFGTPLNMPAVIEAEKFDRGGNGVAYRDMSSGNESDMFRSGDVDITTAVDGSRSGYALGWTQAGEWLNYSVNVPTAGTYTFDARVSSDGAGGQFHLEVDGADATGLMGIRDTGGWQDWATVSRAGIKLSAGRHVLRLVMDSVGSTGFVGNFNWLRIH